MLYVQQTIRWKINIKNCKEICQFREKLYSKSYLEMLTFPGALLFPKAVFHSSSLPEIANLMGGRGRKNSSIKRLIVRKAKKANVSV